MIGITDARKSLPVLRQEWAGCTRCSLSEHRETVGGSIVFGEGRERGILFLGEGPGATEEREGRPFVGKSGDLLRKFIERYNIGVHYITNIVACRACSPLLDGAGNPVLTQGWGRNPPKMRYKDQPPTTAQIEECSQRVYEEIYMADPIVIVALGQPAATFLSGSSVQISKMRGTPMEIQIPGAGTRALLSDKKQEWVRKVKGQYIMPVEQSQVRYLMVPTFHPAYVLKQQHNMNPNNPFECFAYDLLLAKSIYNRHYEEVSGITPEAYEDGDTPYDILEELNEQERD